MAWIKLCHDVFDAPEVCQIAEASGTPEAAVVGYLAKMWCWFDKHTDNGCAKGVTCKWLDRYLGFRGLAEILLRVGWLERTEEGLQLPNFDRHNSKSAKSRALSALRMKKARDPEPQNVALPLRSRCAPSVTSAQPEQSRAEKSNKGACPPQTPPANPHGKDDSGEGGGPALGGALEIHFGSPETRRLANRIGEVVLPQGDRERLLVAQWAAVVDHLGAEESIDEVLRRPTMARADSKIGYFRKALRGNLEDLGHDLEALARAVEVPARVGKPK